MIVAPTNIRYIANARGKGICPLIWVHVETIMVVIRLIVYDLRFDCKSFEGTFNDNILGVDGKKIKIRKEG